MKETNEEIEPIAVEGSAKQDNEARGPRKKLLRKPATRVGRILFAVVVATVIIGGTYAVVKLNQQSIVQTGPSVPVQSVSAGCTNLSATPISVLAGDGGGDIKFDCAGSAALTTVNGTATVEVTGVAAYSGPVPPGMYIAYFFVYPSAYPGPFGAGYSCFDIPGNIAIDVRHFDYPITLGTGSWDYCLGYENQTSAGSLNMITVTWTPVANWPT